MNAELLAVGERVRSRLTPGMSQRELARRAQMTPDALSRALNGHRGFSTLELTRISEILGTELHWLITGAADPNRIAVSARHQWDPDLRVHANPGQPGDEPIIAQVRDVYRSAFPDGPPSSVRLSGNSAHVRDQLGPDFVRRFAEVLESRLGVDVVRVPRLTTDYSMTIGDRGVIILAAMPHWFRSNWSLAHELGHLVLGHHDQQRPDQETKRVESEADKFASDLLLPADLIDKWNWSRASRDDLVAFLWDNGVSTKALAARLRFLRRQPSPDIAAALTESTHQLLRDHGNRTIDAVAITDRQQQASARRFPIGLLTALRTRVEQGDGDPSVLAWALGVSVDEIDFPEPDDSQDADLYESAIADRPGPDDLADWLKGWDRQAIR